MNTRMHSILIFFLSAALGSGCASGPRATLNGLPTDLVAEKARLLALLDHPPEQTLELVRLAGSSARRRAFAQLYRDAIWSHEKQVFVLDFKRSILHLLSDRALFDGPVEQADWEKRKNALDAETDALNADPAWLAARRKWAALAKGLHGELAEHARRLPDPGMGDARMGEIFGRIRKADNESPFNLTYGAASKEAVEVQKRWKQGLIDLETATRQFEELQRKGLVAMGLDLVTKAGHDLDELAVLRSRYAREKGFSTWARYRVAEQAKGYSGDLKTVPGRLRYLNGVLVRTRKPYTEAMKQRFGGHPLHAAALRLVPIESAESLDSYFPVAKAEERWRAMVRDSGFEERMLAEIHLDTQPRKSKFASAYTMPVAFRRPKVVRIDVRTLDLVIPDWTAKDEWLPAEVHVVLSLAYDGMKPQLNLFHEGGHALDLASREYHFEMATPYAYTETTSMMFENYYLTDSDTLRAVGMPEAAVKARRASKSEFNSIFGDRMQATECLIELLLWDYDYAKPGAESFVSRTLDLYGKLMARELGLTYGPAAGLDPRMLAFSQDRYYKGFVRNLDYILASASAKVTAEALKDRLAKTSGRRSLYKQPLLGPTLTEGLLRHGFSSGFPRAIEDFAGKRFGH